MTGLHLELGATLMFIRVPGSCPLQPIGSSRVDVITLGLWSRGSVLESDLQRRQKSTEWEHLHSVYGVVKVLLGL